MTSKDRMGRAEDYVFGLMDERERMRAERDMVIDPTFRQCVMELAQKLQDLHETRKAAPATDDDWNDIAARIADLPQMAGLPPTRAGKPQPARHAAAGPARPRLSPRRPVGRGLHETGGRRGFVVALGIVAVFVIGYLVGHLR